MTDKISTGCNGLDEVLYGGIPANTCSILMGAPGTGKTILAQEVAFHNATKARPALYLTTLSEPLERFISHGQHYTFFDADKVGVSVFYEDLGLTLRNDGIGALPEVITDLFIKYNPQLLFIDSFKALNDLVTTDKDRRTLIYDLATALAAYKCTSFLIGEYSEEMTTSLPEFAVADVVLNLMKLSHNGREQRFLRIEKLRASDSMPGMHAFEISQDGIQMYPRLLTPRVVPSYKSQLQRISTGVKSLDEMLNGGLWMGTTTLIAGPSGSGKTILALHFVREGALHGEPSLFVSFQENPTQVARVVQTLGWNADELLNDSVFELMYRSSVEMQLDSIAAEVFQRVRSGKVRRVVFDSLDDLERCSIDTQRFADFIYALVQWFAVENVTCLMIRELQDLFEVHAISEHAISNSADNIILLSLTPGAEMQRAIRIIKTRGSAHDNRVHVLEIGNEGAVVKRTQ